jgi:hypothetical protein
MSEENKRVSRESDQRAKDVRKKVWSPPSSLDAPPPPKGFVHRWLRAESMGYQDTGNMSKKLREGWELVRADQLIEQIGPNDYPVISSGTHEGVVGVAEMPINIDRQSRVTFGSGTKK